MTTQQASALAHSPVKPGVLRSSANGPITTESCYYFFKGGNEPGVFIATADLDGNGPALFAELRAENRNFDSEYRSVPGVGGDAFYANQNLTILSGNTGVILFVGRANGESRGLGGIPDEKKLAALVLPQL